ncbi:hypothetical protein AWB76_05217 [Caballeronia temeraria]|uniref:DUF2252 domain-containing protein n=2 Tax=Caballeronia temeraria TaxID=1777137 RepID=A0A158C7L3_9BURK|nr:hypothetical protein AWB76_05217 [Caballeronia temeraria]
MMAFDLSTLPRTDVIVQFGGDAHLANFGLFASPERRILFGPNDFDETLPGPFDWDVRRLAASFVIAARERGFPKNSQRHIVRRLCATFRQRIAAFSKMDTLDVWYHQFESTNLLAMADSAEERRKELAVIVMRSRTRRTGQYSDQPSRRDAFRRRANEHPMELSRRRCPAERFERVNPRAYISAPCDPELFSVNRDSTLDAVLKRSIKLTIFNDWANALDTSSSRPSNQNSA